MTVPAILVLMGVIVSLILAFSLAHWFAYHNTVNKDKLFQERFQQIWTQLFLGSAIGMRTLEIEIDNMIEFESFPGTSKSFQRINHHHHAEHASWCACWQFVGIWHKFQNISCIQNIWLYIGQIITISAMPAIIPAGVLALQVCLEFLVRRNLLCTSQQLSLIHLIRNPVTS